MFISVGEAAALTGQTKVISGRIIEAYNEMDNFI